MPKPSPKCRDKQSPGLSAWLGQLASRVHTDVAAVALANKMARVAMGSPDQKRGLSASAEGDFDRGAGLQLTPGKECQAWKSLRRFPQSQTSDDGFSEVSARSAGEQRDGTMVQPGNLATCNTEEPFEAVQLVRTRAQRIPSRSRASAQSKTGYICADQPSPSLFACDTAADHTFRIADHTASVGKNAGSGQRYTPQFLARFILCREATRCANAYCKSSWLCWGFCSSP
jgi:hypothetical protein